MKALISALFFILVTNGYAKEMRYYDVEVIIVENLSEKEKNSENWPIQVNLTRPEKTIQLGKPVLSEWLPQGVDLRSSYKVLKSRHYKLKNQVKKISESKTQRVIYHTAWRQPGLDKRQSLPIYFKHEVAPPPIIENKISDNTSDTDDEVVQVTKMGSILEGVLRVTLSRFLHLEAELSYREKTPALVDSDNPFSVLDDEQANLQKESVIHLKQKRRRMRSSELHYVDHPVLGILIQITPYK